MQKLIGSGLIALALIATSLPAAAAPERGQSNGKNVKIIKVEKQVQKKSGKQVTKKVVKKNVRKTHAAGHRFQAGSVTVVKDWQGRGLPRPQSSEVYVFDGSDIYLAAAATLIVKALID